MAFDLNVNGTRHTVDADPQTPLLWVIRDHIGLTGTKFSCGIGQCGACTVHVDGQPVRSCSVPADTAVGKRVTTIEGRLAGWQPSDPGRLEGIRYASVRLLPVRDDHERARPAAATPQPFRRRYQHCGDERLPLRHLPPRPAGDPSGRRPDEGREATMSENGISDVNRREFLAMVAAAQGAFILGFWVPPRANAQTASRLLVRGSRDARDQRLDRHLAGRHRNDPDRADGTRPGSLDLQRHDGLRGIAVRLEQGTAAIRVREPRRPREGARVDAESDGQWRHRSQRRRRTRLRESRPHWRRGYSRQSLSAHAHERGVISQGRPVLPAACRSRGARAIAAGRRGSLERAGGRADRQRQHHHACAERPHDDVRTDCRSRRPDAASESGDDHDQVAGPVDADGDRAEEPRRAGQGHRQDRLRDRRSRSGHEMGRRESPARSMAAPSRATTSTRSANCRACAPPSSSRFRIRR